MAFFFLAASAAFTCLHKKCLTVKLQRKERQKKRKQQKRRSRRREKKEWQANVTNLFYTPLRKLNLQKVHLPRQSRSRVENEPELSNNHPNNQTPEAEAEAEPEAEPMQPLFGLLKMAECWLLDGMREGWGDCCEKCTFAFFNASAPKKKKRKNQTSLQLSRRAWHRGALQQSPAAFWATVKRPSRPSSTTLVKFLEGFALQHQSQSQSQSLSLQSQLVRSCICIAWHLSLSLSWSFVF